MSGSRRHQRLDNAASTLSDYDKQIISESPVLYLPLSGGSGGVADHSFNGHTGQAVNAPTLTALPNGDAATVFDGATQYVEVPDNDYLSITKTGVLTVEAWMRPDVLEFPHDESTGYVHWMGKGVHGQNEYVSRMYSQTTTDTPARPNRISGYSFNLGGGLGAGSYFQDAVSSGEWIHYVLVINTLNTSGQYPTGYTKIFKDGVQRDQDALQDYNITPANGTSPFRIGSVDFNSYFQGAVAKVAIYNYELTPATIHAHYRIIVPPAFGSAAFIKNVGSASTSTAGTALSITVPEGGVSAGSTLIAKVAHEYTVGGPTMADSRGNTYTRDQTSPNSGTTMRASLFSAQINSALRAGDTIQLTTSASVANKAFSVDEFSHIIFSSPLDVKNNTSNTSTTPGTTISVVTTNADDLIYGMVAVNGPNTETYTEDTVAEFNGLTRAGTNSATNDITVNGAYRSVPAVSTYKYQPTLGTSESWIEILASYKAGTPVVTPPTIGTASFIQFIGSAASKTAGTTLTISVPTGGVPAGHTLIIRSVADFTSNGATVTDTRGNSYTRDRTAANGGSTIRASISSGFISTDLQDGDTITITWPSSVTVRAAVIDEFNNIANPTTVDTQNGATNISTTPAVNLTPTNADDLLVTMVAVEGPTDETFTNDTLHQWSGLTRAGTTGGSTTSNRTVNGAYRAVGSTGTYTYAPTLGTSESWVNLAVAYKAGTPVVTPPPVGNATFVQTVGSATAQTTGTTLSITVPAGGVPSGHTVILHTLSDIMNNGPSVTDSRGNTYTRDRSAPDSGSTIRFSVFSCPITTDLQAGDTITITFPSSSTTRIAVVNEYSAVLNPVVVDVQNGKAGTGISPNINATTTHASDLLIASVGVAGDSTDSYTPDIGNAWTALTRVGTTGGAFGANRTIDPAYRSVPAAGVYTFAPSLGTSSAWVAFLIAYEAS